MAKLLRLYVGQSKREGVGIVLKDVKRRYNMTPWNRRGPINAAMRDYMNEVTYPDERGEIRSMHPRLEKVKLKRFGTRDLFRAIGEMLGLTRVG